jgi:hypothetical protein
MSSALRTALLLMLFIVTLTASVHPSPIAAAPAAIPAAPGQISEPPSSAGAVLASGHYQLLLLYAPS